MDTNIELLTGAQAVAEGADPSWARKPFDTARHNSRLIEAADLWGRAMSGNRRAMLDLEEALTTSDFPILLGGVFERELLAEYGQITPVWKSFATRSTVKDFRPKSLVDFLGGKRIFDPVGQGEEYKARAKTESKYDITVGKRGARFSLTWEDIVNDDLDAFKRLPNDLGQAAADTEDYLGTGLLAIATGPNTAFFKAGNGNAPTALPLTTDNLAAAITAITSRKDSEGRPIAFPNGFSLVIPPALDVQADIILGATEIRITQGANLLTVSNFLRGRVTKVVNPWLGVIDVSAKSATSWYVVPNPANPRPALTVAFLRGHEAPDLRVKADTGNRVGGGAIDPMEGSFDDDTIQYRGRHVVGATQLDPIGTYASTGS